MMKIVFIHLDSGRHDRAHLRLHEPAAYFLRASLANHHVLIEGDPAQLVDNFMQFCGAR